MGPNCSLLYKFLRHLDLIKRDNLDLIPIFVNNFDLGESLKYLKDLDTQSVVVAIIRKF